ncbi:MAG: M23 family metallopeptidase [Myxococcales bacterium]|nr:M23 family metallopeptidase [Myxococcales bacterium]
MKTRRWHIALGLCLLAAPCAVSSVSSAAPVPRLLQDFDRFERDVMFGRLGRRAARQRLLEMLKKIRVTYGPRLEGRRVPSIWHFPIEGGARRFNVGGRGKGFRPKRPSPPYDFYDGNRHGGHPAHDLFIHDRNRDCRDDRTSKPVRALAMVPGVVIAVNLRFSPGKPRGGRYVWIYNPHLDKLFYYAHLDRVDVHLGQLLTAGAVIGTVGASGFKKPRPCHIHLMVLDVADGAMRPFNYYDKLR